MRNWTHLRHETQEEALLTITQLNGNAALARVIEVANGDDSYYAVAVGDRELRADGCLR